MKTLAAIDEFLLSRRARNLSPATMEWYQGILRRFAATYPELPTEPRPIQLYLTGFQGSHSEESIHDYFRALRAFFRFISDWWKIPNPMVKLRAPRVTEKVRPTLEPDDLARLIDSATKLRDKAIITLFVNSGIRSGELAGLRKQDIKAHTVRFRGQSIKAYTVVVSGKSGQREVPFSEQIRTLLAALIASDGRGDHLFNGHKGPLGKHGIYRIVRMHMRKAGIEGPKLGSHRIRHGFGKNFLVNGGDVRSLQQIMGHKNISTTQKYLNLTLTDVIIKHHKFNPLWGAEVADEESLFNKDLVIKEAEEILKGRRYGNQSPSPGPG